MKKLTPKVRTLLLLGVKSAGTYAPDQVMLYIDEALTLSEYNVVLPFLSWVNASGRKFGHGTIDDVYNQFVSTRSPDKS